MYWQTKTIEFLVKDVDVTKRTISGLFSRFGNVDSDGDVVQRGAFAKTINENGPTGSNRIKHLKNHNPDKMIGRILELTEIQEGLSFTSVMSTNSHGKDALIEYQEGLITEHSFGYNVIDSKQEAGVNILTELRMFEGSAVTWGANPDTPVTGIKGTSTIKELTDELNHVLKYCRVGNLSDDLLSSVEIKIKQIQQQIAYKLEDLPAIKADDLPDNCENSLHIFNSELKQLFNGKITKRV